MLVPISVSLFYLFAFAASDPYSTGSDCKERLISINQELCDMEAILMDLRKSVKDKKEELQAAQVVLYVLQILITGGYKKPAQVNSVLCVDL